MGKRMITYLLVLGAVGYLIFDVYLSGTERAVDFVLLYPAAGIVYLTFCGERTFLPE